MARDKARRGLRGRSSRFARLLAALASIGGTASASDWFHLNGVIEGRVVTTPTSRAFLDEGLGKTRYGHEPRAVQAHLSQAALLARAEIRPDLSLRIHANFDADHNFNRRVDVVEALARYTPAISDTVSLDVRAGVFFPTVSLENTEPAWLSPYTTTFSAINAWIGEEVKSVGVEAGPSFRKGEAQIRIFGAATRHNDPNGTLLAWRGFALHDRVSGFSDHLPLPPLKSFNRPDLFPDQPQYVEPLREVDSKWTWSSGLSVTAPKYRLKALYQPKTASPGVFDGLQYAWRTGYWAVGASRTLGPIEFVTQGLDGETRMGIVPGHGNAVVVGFQALYGLVSWSTPETARQRISVRYDAFRTRDRDDFKLEDPNDESGSAWTFAYSVSPSSHHRITAELLSVRSSRTNRKDLGLDPDATEILGSLSWRVSF